MKEDIRKCFDKIVGQRNAIETLVRVVLAYAMGGNAPRVVLSGLAGLGKSYMMQALRRALVVAENGCDQSVFCDSPEAQMNVLTAPWLNTSLVPALRDIRPLHVFVDEAHELTEGSNLSGPKLKFRSFLKQAISEDADRGKVCEFSMLKEGIHVSARDFGITIGTNFLAKMKDGDAIKRRFNSKIELELYSLEEIIEIVTRNCTSVGLRAHETAILKVARCGRGTCEAPNKIVGDLSSYAQSEGKSSVNAEDVNKILQQTSRYPRGLAKHEVKCLEICKDEPWKPAQLAIALGKETKAINEGLNWLQAQMDSKGNRIPLIQPAKGGYITTSIGVQYLEGIRKEGFKW